MSIQDEAFDRLISNSEKGLNTGTKTICKSISVLYVILRGHDGNGTLVKEPGLSGQHKLKDLIASDKELDDTFIGSQEGRLLKKSLDKIGFPYNLKPVEHKNEMGEIVAGYRLTYQSRHSKYVVKALKDYEKKREHKNFSVKSVIKNIQEKEKDLSFNKPSKEKKIEQVR